jgi:hypothetical protein
MYYFIFSKNLDNVERTLHKIAENEYDLNNLNINTSDYKIIEDSQENFNAVKFNTKYPSKYNGNVITFITEEIFFNKEDLQSYINNYKIKIKQYTDNNPNSPLLSRWNNYYNQLNNLNLDSITYPLNKSLEQYFNDIGQPSYNILQLP